MMNHARSLLMLAAAAVCYAQSDDVDRLVVPFSDASRPRIVRVNLLNGSITVKGADIKDVIVESKIDSRPAPEGMRRIPMRSGLQAEEENNVVRISTSGSMRSGDLVIQVPRATSLQLKAVNSRQLTVEGVEGDHELSCNNGKITMTNVSGSVVAHALNGDMVVTFDKVRNDKPMSFSSLNGNIDITFPADVRGRWKMKSERGDVLTDFDVKLEASSKPAVEEGKAGGGKYRVRIDRAVTGTVNGGGPDMTFTTLNGRIYLRKKQ